ncbi:MAG: TIGR03619 family F420-dependent LLM class oxidoreductase [Acidimicrobiales bacterium]
MRFSYAESMTDPSFYLPLARAAEEAGFDSFVVPDSICYPRESDSTYPYTPDGNREFLEDKPFIEPFSLIPAMGAVTERLRFTTFVVKLPIRNPVLVAKQAASVAVITGNRFGFGVGLSPWPEDYIACGQPWERRGKRMDEQIEIIQQLAAGGFVEYHGEFYDLPAVKICPTPTEKLPILIGGHADAALKRAARLCDGWMHAGSDGEQLPAMIGRLGDLRREYGREDEPFEIHVISMDGYSADGCRRLEELGVTDVIIGFRNAYQMEQDTETLQQKIDAMKWFADSVISPSRSL